MAAGNAALAGSDEFDKEQEQVLALVVDKLVAMTIFNECKTNPDYVYAIPELCDLPIYSVKKTECLNDFLDQCSDIGLVAKRLSSLPPYAFSEALRSILMFISRRMKTHPELSATLCKFVDSMSCLEGVVPPLWAYKMVDEAFGEDTAINSLFGWLLESLSRMFGPSILEYVQWSGARACTPSERFPKTTPTNCVFGKRSPWVNVFQKRCSRVDQPKSYTFWCEQRGRSVTSAVNVTHKGERRARLPLFCSPLWCIHSAWSRDQEKRRVSGKRSLWVNTFQKRCSSWF